MAEQTDAKSTTEKILELRRHADSNSEPLGTGVWYDDFNQVKAAAERSGSPLFAMWINPGCGFCKRFCTVAVSDRFREWQESSGAYFWLGSRTDADQGASGREFVFRQSESDDIEPQQRFYFPGIAIWQCEAGAPDKVIHDYRASGRVFEREKSGDEGISNTLKRIEKALQEPPHKEFVPPKTNTAEVAASNPQHIKLLRQIAALVSPFAPPRAVPVPLVKMNLAAGGDKIVRVVQALVDNEGHCPCKKDKSPDTLCLCKEFRTTGKCECGIFERYNA